MKYKRILLKLSGETLGGPEGRGLDEQVIDNFAARIARIAQSGVQVAIVVGGGNIFRGLQGTGKGFDRVHGDQMGMLATVINSKALAIFIRNHGVQAEVFTSTPMRPMARYYMRDEVVDVLEKGGVALLSGGTGNPFFTTDSGASLRACEIGADAILKATKAIADNLKVMDLTAFAMCKENKMPIVVFNINREGELERAAAGEKAGTLVC